MAPTVRYTPPESASAPLSCRRSTGGGRWTESDRHHADDPHWRQLVRFHEYFDGDDGRGVGASHQTGWTALAIRCLETHAAHREGRGNRAARQTQEHMEVVS